MKAASLIYHLWAKTNELATDNAGEWTFHPLPCHLVDVGHVAEAWLAADTILAERFSRLWPDVSGDEIHRALVMAAALHDLGKGCPNFQAKSEAGWNNGYGSEWTGRAPLNGTGFDHGLATSRLFDDLESPFGATPVTEEWMPFVPLMRIAGGHHGALFLPEQLRSTTSCSAGPRSIEYQCVQALIDTIVSHFGPVPEIAEPIPSAFLMLAAGFISVSDWIGSDERYFGFRPNVQAPGDLEAYLESHRHRRPALKALQAAGLIAGFDKQQKGFKDRFGFSPYRGFQKKAIDMDFGHTPGAEICLIEAPMGLGKTEIALSLAAQTIQNGNASGLYFALPTQASANALFQRILSFSAGISVGDLALMLAHGARRYFPEFRKLIEHSPLPFARDAQGLQDPDAPSSEVISTQWLQPSKRALLAPIGLGTIDQAMLGAMGVRHGFVRLFGLARKVVVFDEIHAYDLYMNTILFRLLAWLRELDTKVILLSATLPSSLRDKLFESFGASSPDVLSEAYPQIISAQPGRGAQVLSGHVPERLRKTIRIETVESESSTASGIAWIRGALQKGGCIAWIRNTVREAQEAYSALMAEGVAEVDLLHARFTRADRNQKEEALLDALGKQPKKTTRPTSRVVIATQVIEQSVDLDFDAMLSDLAPVDLLLQRAGRLWRHADRLPSARHGHSVPVLSVLLPSEEARFRMKYGASGYVYDSETLARSAILVKEHRNWAMPDACRELVSLLYDRPESQWTSSALNVDAERLSVVRKRKQAGEREMATLAKRILVSRPGREPQMRDARRDGESDTAIALATRLGGSSVSVVLCKKGAHGPTPIGLPELSLDPPPDGDFRARLRTEEAIALSTVSFPWYGSLSENDHPDTFNSELEMIRQWWNKKHPFDDRRFVLLDNNGLGFCPDISLRYTEEQGLVVKRKQPAAPDSVAFEKL